MITGSDGTLSLAGLNAGTEYILSEAKAPAGYSLNGNTLKIKIVAQTDDAGDPTGVINQIVTEEQNGGQAVESGKESWTAALSSDNKGKFSVSLKDTKIPGLPETGGTGTAIFTVVGVVLMVLALFVLFLGKRRKAERK